MHWVVYLVAVSLVAHQYASSPVPNGSEEQEIIDEVKELENLRNENVVINNTEKANRVDNAAKEASPAPNLDSELEPQPEPEPDAEPQPNSRSAIFRHRGITQAKKNKYGPPNLPLTNGYAKFGGVQYSPTDLAAYVFTTGDEEGVALAVEELVREGTMGRTDAINYLQYIKQVLNFLKEKYEEQKKIQELQKNRLYSKQMMLQLFPPREQFMPQLSNEKREQPKVAKFPSVPAMTTEAPHQAVIVSTSEPKHLTKLASTTARPKIESSTAPAIKEEKGKGRVVQVEDLDDFEFSLLYQFAKKFFIRSMLTDDPVAEDRLSVLISIMDEKFGRKNFSPELKEKTLDIISQALVDSLREYERMMPQTRLKYEDGLSMYNRMFGEKGANSENDVLPENDLSAVHNKAAPLPSKSNRPKSS